MPTMKQLRIGSVNYDTVGEVSVTQTLTSGTEIGSVTIDGTSTTLYAPTPTTYTLPAATTSTLGGVIVGSGLAITNGVLSLDVASASGVSF